MLNSLLCNVEPSRTLMFGDSLERDVEGALNAGLQAIWLDRTGKGPTVKLPQGVGYLSNLSELRRWIGPEGAS